MIEELEKIIVQNIKEIPKCPLSLLLSGGIDSSLVLALLRKTYPDREIHSFSLSRSATYPDTIFSRKIAKMFDTKYHQIILSDSDFNDFQREYDQIKKFNFKGDVNVYILCSIASKYSRIIVTGDGGDECFGGYWLHKHPLGHKENGLVTSFEEIHPNARIYLTEMVDLGIRNFLFKEKSQEGDYADVWEYFVRVMAPQHLEPLWHSTKLLNVDVYTPLFSESLIDFMRKLPYKERIGRKIEKELAMIYLPQSIVERKSIGFDAALGSKDKARKDNFP